MKMETPLITNTPEAEDDECECNVCRNSNHFLRIIEKLDSDDKEWMKKFLEHYLDWSADYIELKEKFDRRDNESEFEWAKRIVYNNTSGLTVKD